MAETEADPSLPPGQETLEIKVVEPTTGVGSVIVIVSKPIQPESFVN